MGNRLSLRTHSSVQTIRCWHLNGDPLPETTLTVRVAEALRAEVMRESKRRFGTEILPDCLHSPAADDPPHFHAYWLPEDRDGDGRIDHISIVAHTGFCEKSRLLLDGIIGFIVTGAGRFHLEPASSGGTTMASSCAWTSATPFLGPRHSLKGRSGRKRTGRSAVRQLEYELARLTDGDGNTLPAAKVLVLDGEGLPPTENFVLATRASTGPSRPERGYFAVEFTGLVKGPLAAGMASHFGLGRFVPFWVGR